MVFNGLLHRRFVSAIRITTGPSAYPMAGLFVPSRREVQRIMAGVVARIAARLCGPSDLGKRGRAV